MEFTGFILWWSDRDKNGIIKTSDNKEWYFDSSVIKFEPWETTLKRAQVIFEHNEKITDCRCAYNVRLA